jgi:cell division protein FtsW (lipid II flippase)
MRVVSPARRRAALALGPASRHAHLESIGLSVATLVVVFGVALAYFGRTTDRVPSATGANDAPVDLQQLRGPDDLVPLLDTFVEPFERRAVATALYRRASDPGAPLAHVGGLARVTIPAVTVNGDRRYVRLRERLAARPALLDVPVLSPSDLAALKPRVAVRTPDAFGRSVTTTALWLVAAFWAAHAARRWRRTIADPVSLPAVMLLTGIGLASLVALRDPLRDTMPFWSSLVGIAMGLGALVLAAEIDLEASRLRRAVLGPLGVAVALAALLLLFGTGPGTSGARLRLFGFQPADIIRLSVVLALAAHFARRGEFLREYSEEATAARPWLRHVNVPRWKDVGPALVSVGIVVAFFFLQRDLGPALVLSCVFLGMYGVARRRGVLVAGGLAGVLCAFAVAWWTGVPATVRQRVAIWADPWQNGVTGGDQVAHGLWALATGAAWGSGLGRGSGATIPAGDTDFILAVAGEQLGFAGLALIVALYALVCWRCLRTAVRAPGEYSALVALGIALTFVVQACVIASGVLGLLPLSGVVTPFLSYGRSAMVANFLALGIVLAIGRRLGPVRAQLLPAVRLVAVALAVASGSVLARAGWIQLATADTVATAASLTEQADGELRYEYNPRLVSASRLIERGSIYDRRGLPLATSKPAEIAGIAAAYRVAGIDAAPCARDARCYPLGASAFHLLGDWNTERNWAASNSSYVERDRDATLQGFDDRPRAVEIVHPRTGARSRTTRRDLGELLPLARDTFHRNRPAVRALLARDRDLRLTIDARLQARTASALRSRMDHGGHQRGAAVVLDVASGGVLASVSYPLPHADDARAAAPGTDAAQALLDRARYGLYPPGSTFKMLVAAAAMRSGAVADDRTFACVRLPDNRVGNHVRGWARPVRDDVMDHVPHGDVGLERGLVVSCNAYFAQLAVAMGPRPILDAASLFGIEVARPSTEARARRTLAHAGYGQGEVLVSPLRMARVAAAVARDGAVAPVRWTMTPDAAGRTERLLSPAQSGVLGRYLREVVTSGTGRALAAHPVAIAGKTGTAEVDGAPAHSWFAGFAPFGGERRIAFAVIVEHAGYGARSAAPIAGDLVTAARDLELVR